MLRSWHHPMQQHTAQITTNSTPVPVLLVCLQPANVKEVVDRVVAAPYDELAAVLQGFKWAFDKVCVCNVRRSQPCQQ